MLRWIHSVDLLLEHWSRTGVVYFTSGFVFFSPSPNCEAEVYAPLAFRALISVALDGMDAFWSRWRFQRSGRLMLHGHDDIRRFIGLLTVLFPIPSASLLQFKLRGV